MIPETLRPLAVDVATLVPHPRNARQGDIGAISESLRYHGQFRPIVVNKRGNVVLAGNHTLAAAKALGWPQIAVTFVDVDDDEAVRILLADNRLNDLATNDSVVLADLLQSLPSIDGSGYDGDALDELLADLGQTAPEMAGDPDAVPAVPDDQEPITKRGDIIWLGRHTLGCIDSTDVHEVRRLLRGVTPDMVWTDPPYGIAFDPMKDRSNLAPSIARAPTLGDTDARTAVAGHHVAVALGAGVAIFWGANHYASHLPDSPAWIVWDKENSGDFADVELAWTNTGGAARLFRHMWNGMLKDSERGERRVHPAQKPVALAEWCFTQYGKEGDVVLDLFGGSGTCLIAAERTGRTCYMAELSEHYCDCIIARWEAATGQKAERHERVLAGA